MGNESSKYGYPAACGKGRTAPQEHPEATKSSLAPYANGRPHLALWKTAILVGLVCGFFATPSRSSSNIAQYFSSLYGRFIKEYSAVRLTEYESLCDLFNIDLSNERNIDQFHKIYFIHDLMTGSMCIDFISGGVLRLPYVWHWTEPNPRHSITYSPTSSLLSAVAPPREFDRYKSYADIDRVPSLYIGDLFAAAPKYYHPAAGNFYSFGWCSEREMAYSALLSVLGFRCKIKQEGIHTWSEVWLDFSDSDGNVIELIAFVDNSVDTVDWKIVPRTLKFDKWSKDYGEGTQIAWYNKTAKSEGEKAKLLEIRVTPENSQWIETSLRKWLQDVQENDDPNNQVQFRCWRPEREP